jgi:hypothetical protein
MFGTFEQKRMVWTILGAVDEPMAEFIAIICIAAMATVIRGQMNAQQKLTFHCRF